MTRKRRVCFIDDEQDELNRAKEALGYHFDFGTGKTLSDARARIRGKPELFLLDMYYAPDLSDAERLDTATNWQKLVKSQQAFYSGLRNQGQSKKSGRDLQKQISTEFPGVPIVFFTRKGSLEDASEAMCEGATSVLKKPDASMVFSDTVGLKKALDEAMKDHSSEIIRRLEPILASNTWWARNKGFVITACWTVCGAILGFGLDRVSRYIFGW